MGAGAESYSECAPTGLAPSLAAHFERALHCPRILQTVQQAMNVRAVRTRKDVTCLPPLQGVLKGRWSLHIKRLAYDLCKAVQMSDSDSGYVISGVKVRSSLRHARPEHGQVGRCYSPGSTPRCSGCSCSADGHPVCRSKPRDAGSGHAHAPATPPPRIAAQQWYVTADKPLCSAACRSCTLHMCACQLQPTGIDS